MFWTLKTHINRTRILAQHPMSKTEHGTADTERSLDAGKRAPEVRHYLLIDSGTQWFCKLARIEVEITWEPQKKGASIRKETVVKEQLVDVPGGMCGQSTGGFLQNVYGRQLAFDYQRFGNDHYYGWSLSPTEHARIARLIELQPAVNEYNRLVAYTV